MLLEKVSSEEIAGDVLNRDVIEPFPMSLLDEDSAWLDLLRSSELNPAARQIGVMLLNGMAAAEEIAVSMVGSRFVRKVVNPGPLALRIPEVRMTAKITALTAFSRFVRQSPLLEAPTLYRGDTATDGAEAGRVGDLMDPYFADPGDMAYGVVATMERFRTAYYTGDLPEPFPLFAWYRLPGAHLLYAKVVRPATVSDDLKQDMARFTGSDERAKAAMMLDDSVRIMPFLSRQRAVLDSVNRN